MAHHAATSTPPANPTPADSIMLRLREDTRAQHEHAESRPLEQALFRGTLPRQAFIDMLGQRFLIHRRLEELVGLLGERHPFVAQLIQARLLQTPNLRADLEFFGQSPDAIAPLPETTVYLAQIDGLFTTHPIALLGAYYVFEGSKNGARILARTVAQAYGLQDQRGLRYLDPHGAEQRAFWSEFKTSMDAAPLSPGDRDAIVDAARKTFDAISALDDALAAAHSLNATGR